MKRNNNIWPLGLAFIFVFLLQVHLSAQVPVSDSLALVALYDSTGGNNWVNNENWKSPEPVSSWYGVYVLDGRVESINLISNNLTGTLPHNIGDLTALYNLALENNLLSGRIPSSIENLTNLNFLNLAYNRFNENDIPTSFAHLSALVELIFNANNFNNIPSSIMQLPKIKRLYFGHNYIGSLPPTIAGLDSLETLFLNYNNLNGVLPTEITSLSHLQDLYIAGNNFTEIPQSVLSMTWLKTLDMSSNQLDENDLSGLGDLSGLEELNLRSMALTQIPLSVTSLSSLNRLYLDYNLITSAGLGDLGNLTQLTDLGLSGNGLTTFPVQIFNMPNLVYLALGSNEIRGTLPTELFQLSALRTLYLGYNHFSGALPAEITDLDNLVLFDIADNEITDLPDLSEMSALRNAFVQNNRLTFEDLEPNVNNPQQNISYIPQKDVGVPFDTTLVLGQTIVLARSIGGTQNSYQWYKNDAPLQGANDTTLEVSVNNELDYGQFRLHATSSIVSGLELLSAPFNIQNPHFEENDSLALVALYNSLDGANWTHNDNWLSGPVSGWYGVVRNGGRVVRLELPDNNLTGDIPPAIGDLTGLNYLDLSDNKGLSGTLPEEIGNLGNLNNLFLENINISALPPSVGNLTNLSFLELSSNNLNSLPASFADLTMLQELRLNANQFTLIPAPVLQIPALRSLSLNDNQITNIPAEIANLTQLSLLNLDNNPLVDNISPALGTMASLSYLSLNSTQMTTLPEFITNMTQLSALNIGNNNLTIEDLVNIRNLTNLSSLNLEDLGLNNLPEGFGDLVNLKSLWLRNNNLMQGAFSFLGNLTKLEILALSYNKLTAFPSSLWSLSNLWNLMLDYNDISGSIPIELATLGMLNTVNLSHNQLSGDVPQEIVNLTNLESLDISYNQLSGLPDLSALNNLNFLYANNNRFTFEDIEPNINAVHIAFMYAFQDSVGQKETRVVAPGAPASFSVDVGGAHNIYAWYKNGNLIQGATENTFVITNAELFDTGVYECHITNSVVPDLTIYSRPITLEVKGKPFIVMGGIGGLTPKSVTITAQVGANGFPTNAFVEYGISQNYDHSVPAEQNPITGQGAVSIAVQLSALDANTTYNYRIKAVNDSGTAYSSERDFTTLPYPSQISLAHQIELPAYSNPEDYQTTDYRMIGLPGLSDAMISDFLNGTQEQDWMVYWDNGAAQDYYVSFDGSAQFRCDAGKAFWIISADNLEINSQVQAVPLDEWGQAVISLHSGWNMITCPFTLPVKWSDIKEANGLGGQQLYSFEGSYDFADYLSPYKGYYFNAPEGMTSLTIPFPSGGGVQLAKTNHDNPFAWKVNVSLQSDGYTDETTCFGLLSDSAEQAASAYNFLKPHGMGDILNIFFNSSDSDGKMRCLASDIRDKGRQFYRWQFTTHLFPNKKAKLSFNGIQDVPEEQEIYLIDRTLATSRNLRTITRYSFIPQSNRRNFEVVMGTHELVQKELAKVHPKNYRLGTNYPNPFNPQTTIPVALPGESSIDLSVYDALGKKVATVFSGIKEAGNHLFHFNLNTISGRALGSGVYFYRLSIKGQKVMCKKMILLK